MNIPHTSSRAATPIDTVVGRFDRLLKSALGPHIAGRRYPAEGISETVTDPAARKRIAGFIRVNHAGEICAQALYHGQALTARAAGVRDSLERSAQEETDHLAWCAQRLEELGDHPSLLDPLWYAGSFAIGALAGISGDQRSLGFVAETENQVIEHLQSHLAKLPEDDARSRALLTQMMEDEARHGGHALQNGGVLPPLAIRMVMKLTAKIMTTTARWI